MKEASTLKHAFSIRRTSYQGTHASARIKRSLGIIKNESRRREVAQEELFSAKHVQHIAQGLRSIKQAVCARTMQQSAEAYRTRSSTRLRHAEIVSTSSQCCELQAEFRSPSTATLRLAATLVYLGTVATLRTRKVRPRQRRCSACASPSSLLSALRCESCLLVSVVSQRCFILH